jgi:hypothetical protein
MSSPADDNALESIGVMSGLPLDVVMGDLSI